MAVTLHDRRRLQKLVEDLYELESIQRPAISRNK